MIHETHYAHVSLGTHHGIPVAVKRYHDASKNQNYMMERDALLLLNGKFRTPRLLAYDDATRTLSIEWIAGDRLKEYCIKKYLNRDDAASFSNPAIIQRAQEAFKEDTAADAQRIKNTICSVVRMVHAYGIAHGDVEFRHVVLAPDGRIYLIDFSNAALHEHARAIFEADYQALTRHFGIDWQAFEQAHSGYVHQKYYQSCVYPDGFISGGDGQGSTERKFDFLGIRDMSGCSFLDLGCAEGECCRMAARTGAAKVWGIDQDAAALERGRTLNRLWGYAQVSLHHDDITRLPQLLQGEQFDVVNCFSVVHHFLSARDTRRWVDVLCDPGQAHDRAAHLALLNMVLAHTRYVMFYEIPFYGDGGIDDAVRYCALMNKEIEGTMHVLGVWHANASKQRVAFRIEKAAYAVRLPHQRIEHEPALLAAWHRNMPLVLRQAVAPHGPSTG